MLALQGILCIWAFAVLTRAQGLLGGKQYPPCNSSILQGSQYIGCYDLSKEVLQLQITGTDPTLYSYYPGWIENGDPTAAALFDNSVDPANCTIACRGHGYKYAALYGGNACRCMGNAPSTLAPLSSTNPLDPVTLNSCHVPGQYIPGNCPGDSSQFCGTGTYADVYVDNSFPLSSTINPSVEQNQYSYIGCFHPGGGGNVNVGQLSYRVPAANVSGATSLTPCFDYCATLGFPFVEFDGANSYTSCLCGTEISHGYQQPDSNCKGDCVGGSTCPGGSGCCGQRRSNTIYFNPDLVGCYEAPIPSASFVAGAPEQTYSEPTGGPTMVGHTATTAAYTGPFVVATNPPSIPSFQIRYYNLGCWQRTAASAPIISGPVGPLVSNSEMTVEACLNFCSFFGTSYASITNETTNGFTCRCGSGFGANNGQQPVASCHQLCPGNSPPQTYEYCGGVAINEQIFGPQSATSSSSSTVISTTTSSSTQSTTTSQSATTSSTSSSQSGSSSGSNTSSSSSQVTSSQTSSTPSFSSSLSSSSSTSTSSSSISSSSSLTSTTMFSSSSIQTSPTQQTSSFISSSSLSTSSTFSTITSSSTSSQTSSSQSQVSSSTTTITTTTAAASTSLASLDCQPDNCLRQFEQSTAAVSAFCATYTTSVDTDTTGLPNFVSQCSSTPSRISSACSCVVTNSVSITSSSIASSFALTSITSSTLTSSPTQISPSQSSSSTSLSSPASSSPISTITFIGTSLSSTSQPTTASTNTAPANNNCSPDNCLRQFNQSPAVTAFCATYTALVQTDTTGLPSYVSQCSSQPSRISSACSCVVTETSPSSLSSASSQSSSPSTASMTTSTMISSFPHLTTSSSTPPVSDTSTSTVSSTTTDNSANPPQGCSPDNCYRQFQQSPVVTPFCETYTTAIQTDTSGLPPYVSQCQSMPARISSACSCVVTGSSPPTTTVTTSTTQTTTTTATMGPVGTTTITQTSSTTTTATTSNPVATPPVQNCSPDNCYRQFQQSSEVTPFCETYTTAVQTDTTGLPSFVSQCQSVPSRISSACSCVVTGGSSPSNPATSIISVTSAPTQITGATETSNPASSPTPPAQNCSPDNCLRQFSESLSDISTFCSTYTTAVETDTTALPPFVSQCSSDVSRVSSACSCIVAPMTSLSYMPSSPPASSPAPTVTSMPPVNDCSPDNCLRQFSQSLSDVSTFCSTYTTAVETDITVLPPFVSQCSNDVSRVSSACSCVVAPTNSQPYMPSYPPTSSPASQSYMQNSPPASSPALTITSTPPVENCSPDNCLRQFSQSLSDVSIFCATYTTDIYTDSTGLPPFVSQCSSTPYRVSSACSCIVSPPIASPSTPISTTLMVTTSPTAPPVLDCQPDNCLRQYSQSLSEVSSFCATYTTDIETDTTGLPPFVSQCSNDVLRVSSACSCIVSPPTLTPTITETSQSAVSPTTSPCVPEYGLECPSSMDMSTISPIMTPSTITTTATEVEPSSQTGSTPSPSGIITGTETSPSISTASPTPTNSPLENVPIIIRVQPGNSGYFKKRQTSQSYIASGGTITGNCSMGTVYILFQNQLFINGTTIISANPYDVYEAFGVPNGLGTITTTFAVDGNNLLTWHNANFVDDQAYFCEQSGQIYALFSGLDYGDYPVGCQIVSLVTIPASYCQNGVITTVSTQPAPSSTSPALSAQSTATPATGTGSQSQMTSSGGFETYIPSFPANFYATAPSDLVCVSTEYVLTYGAMTTNPMPTYARRDN